MSMKNFQWHNVCAYVYIIYTRTYILIHAHTHKHTHTHSKGFFLKPLTNLRLLILGLMLFGWFISIYLIPFFLWEFHFLFTTSWFTSIFFSETKKYGIKQGLGLYVFYRYAMNSFMVSWRPFTWNRSDHTTTSNTKFKDVQNYTSFHYFQTRCSITQKVNLLS